MPEECVAEAPQAGTMIEPHQRNPAFAAPAVSPLCAAAETIIHSLGFKSKASADAW